MPFDVAADGDRQHCAVARLQRAGAGGAEIAAAHAPGQFVMVKAASGHDPLLRRPFSVFEVLRDASGAPTGISHPRSSASAYPRGCSTSARGGDTIACLGPLGRPFTLVDPPAEGVDGGRRRRSGAVLDARAKSLSARGVGTTLFYGARRAEELFYLDFFRSLGVELVLTTEDGSAGETGPRHRAARSRAGARDRQQPGHDLRLRTRRACSTATARTAATFGRPCEVSVERIMGCGMGGCYSCVVPMKRRRRAASTTCGRASPAGARRGTDCLGLT